jgi:hypothetical protein
MASFAIQNIVSLDPRRKRDAIGTELMLTTLVLLLAALIIIIIIIIIVYSLSFAMRDVPVNRG